MNLGHVFAQGDIVLITVFLLLVLMSILTWWIIIMRSIRLHQVRHANRGTIEAVATVAGPIGEALVATAVGLFAAIPAVLAYNFIVFGNKQLVQDMDAYAYDLHVKIMNDKE